MEVEVVCVTAIVEVVDASWAAGICWAEVRERRARVSKVLEVYMASVSLTANGLFKVILISCDPEF